MNNRIYAALIALLLAATPALAQWQTPNHSVPIGAGGGTTGFKFATPGTSGQPLVSQGAAADPSFGTIGNAGFTVGPANTVKGTVDGVNTTDLAIPGCTSVSQALRWTSGVGASCGNILVTTGFDMPVNLGLSAAANGGALTLTLTQASGSAPTSSNPVLVPFRSTTATAGTVTWRTITAATSLTIPSGATLGTSSSNVPFRIWAFLEDNGGNPELAAATCSTATAIFPCAAWESTLKTSTAITSSSNTAGVLYAPSAVTLDAVRIIGFCDFSGGLTTAGTWASSCTTLQPMGPGIKKPGDEIQSATASSGAVSTGTTAMPFDNTPPQSGEGDQYLSQAITPTATPNILQVEVQALASNGAVGTVTMALFQDAVGSALAAGRINVTSLNSLMGHLYVTGVANTTSTTTFKLRIGGASGTTTFNGENASGLYGGVSNSYLRVREIMG